jgi:hypothetical protein
VELDKTEGTATADLSKNAAVDPPGGLESEAAEVRGPPASRADDGGVWSSPSNGSLDELAINTIRTLSMDAVQRANSGHPGTPMALAPVAYTLWQRFLCFDPDDPLWPNRDRFVLSNGHASMLLYSLLHLSGVKAIDAFPPLRCSKE